MGKKKVANPDSPFFNFPKIGDSISGVFAGFEETQNGYALNIKNASVKGKHLVGIGTVLKGIVKANVKLFKVGTKIRIDHTGTTKGRKGKPAKLYDVFLNNKQITGSFNKPADASKMSGWLEG